MLAIELTCQIYSLCDQVKELLPLEPMGYLPYTKGFWTISSLENNDAISILSFKAVASPN